MPFSLFSIYHGSGDILPILPGYVMLCPQCGKTSPIRRRSSGVCGTKLVASLRTHGLGHPIWTLERILQRFWDSSSKPPSDGARVSRPVSGKIGWPSGEDALGLITLPPNDSIIAFLKTIKTSSVLVSQLVSSSIFSISTLSSNHFTT